jgi:ATP-dependent helicase/nuclease subunit A
MKSGSNKRTNRESVFQFDQNTCLCAGAGSGKTSALVTMYCSLISGESSFGEPVPLERIVAITFTEKAAAEMKKRVRETLEHKLKEAQDQAIWKEHLRRLEWAPIKTIHSFCAGIIREFSLETGVDPAFTVLDDFEAQELLEQVIHEVVMKGLFQQDPIVSQLVYHYGFSRTHYVDGLKEFLQRLSRKVYASGLGWQQIHQMVEENHQQADAYFLKAVHAIIEDCENLSEVLYTGGIKQSAKCYADLETLVKSLQTLMDIWEGATLLERGDSLIALRHYIKGRWPNVVAPLKKNLESRLREVEMAYYQLLNREQLDGFQEVLKQVTWRYEQWKMKRGVLDFDDLQIKTRNVLRHDRTIREKLKERFKVIMVDEFQDTNQVQKEIVYYLSEENRSASPVSEDNAIRLHPRKLYIVGDPKQSIYCFRGADVTVFLELQSELAGAKNGGKNLFLCENFRSHRGLISFFNSFFNFIMRDGKEHYEINFEEDDHQDYQRESADTGPCVELITVQGEKSRDQQRRREAIAVSKRILEVVQPGSDIVIYERDDGGREIPKAHPDFSDIAILFRRFTHIKLYERELRRREIPYYVVKGRGFFGCQEVKDILNFLKYLDGESDSVALVGLLRSPLVGISDETFYMLLRGIPRNDRPITVGMIKEQLSRVSSKLTQEDRHVLSLFLGIFSQLKNVKNRLAPAELIERIIEHAHYEAVLLTTFQGEQKVANVRKLIELARRFSKRETGLLRDFIAYLTELVERDLLEPEAQTTLENANVVKLMTIHQAKGLEFPLVFLPDMGHSIHQQSDRIVFDEEKGLAATYYRTSSESYEETLAHREIKELSQKKDHAESKRLLYVAVTRARDYLILSGERPARQGGVCWRKWLDQFLERNQELVRIVPDHTIGERSSPKRTSIYENDRGYQHLKRVSVKDSKKKEALIRPILKQSCFHSDFPTEKLRLSVTELSEYMVCPKRYYYRYGMGVEEGIVDTDSACHGSPVWNSTQRKPMISSLDKGNVAHFILKHINFTGDLDQKRLEIDELLVRQGLPPSGSEMEGLKEHIIAFLENDLGRVLLQSDERFVLREMPFHMRLHDQPGSFTVLVQGAVDLVYQDPQGIWNVVDYKYSSGREIDKERYTVQLMIYALAVMKQVKAETIQLTISVLENDEFPLTRWHVTWDEVDRVAEQIVKCAHEITRMQGDNSEEMNVLSRVNVCHRQECFYRTRCLQETV